MRKERALSHRRHVISEAGTSKKKQVAELAIVKCLSRSPLRPEELHEVLTLTQSDLIRDHGLDLYMAEQVKLHATHEQFRLRAQNQFVRNEETEGLYPATPYTRTSPIKENRKNRSKMLRECGEMEQSHSGRMLDYGEMMSDAEEGKMVRRTLSIVARDAQSLASMIRDDDDLPEWCQHYASQAQLMVTTLRQYLEFEIAGYEKSEEGWDE